MFVFVECIILLLNLIVLFFFLFEVYKLKEQFECLNYLNVTFSLKNYWFSDFEIQIQIKITDSLGDKLCKKIFFIQ